MLEYQHKATGDTWVVENFPKLQNLFSDLTDGNMCELHELAESRSNDQSWARAWGIASRLAGIHSLIVPDGIDPARLHPMPDSIVAQVYKTDVAGLCESLTPLQAAWERLEFERGRQIASGVEPTESDDEAVLKAALESATTAVADIKPRPEATPIQQPPIAQAQQQPARGAFPAIPQAPVVEDALNFTQDDYQLLSMGSFSTSIFNYHVNEHDRRTEIAWFIGRIREVRKVLEEPMAKSLASLAILNELQLKRINQRLVTLDPAEKEFLKLQDIKNQLEDQYGKQWGQLEEICPHAVVSTNRKTTINTFSDLVKLYRDARSNPDSMPRDGIFTDDEIQVLLRRSEQDPNVKYRAGWVAACNEAKLGIGDPKWSRKLTLNQCKILDTSFAYAASKISDALEEKKPDLELDTEEGEYPPIHMKADGPITEPDLKLLDEKDVNFDVQIDINDISDPDAKDEKVFAVS